MNADRPLDCLLGKKRFDGLTCARIELYRKIALSFRSSVTLSLIVAEGLD